MASGQDSRVKDSCWPEATSYRQPTCCWSAQSSPIQAATSGTTPTGADELVFMVKATPRIEMLTPPETPGRPYSGVLVGPHLSRPLRSLVPPPFESLSLTLAGSGAVFVTGTGVTNNFILPSFLPSSSSMPAVFHTILSRTKKEKRTKKERIDCYYYPPKTPFQLHWSYYKGSRKPEQVQQVRIHRLQ